MFLLNMYFVLGTVHSSRHALVNKEDVLSALEKLLIQREKQTTLKTCQLMLQVRLNSLLYEQIREYLPSFEEYHVLEIMASRLKHEQFSEGVLNTHHVPSTVLDVGNIKMSISWSECSCRG